MAVISKATSLPILRPLLTYEKSEIIELAKRIGTFQISIMPYKDCCTLFLAKHPVTKANPKLVETFEKRMNLKLAIDESLEKTEIIEIK
jgi:thiamine biosynthesis protein ThiI